ALLGLSRVVGWVDRYIVDGVLNALSALTLRAGDAARRLQTGQPQDYAYGVALGVLILLVWSQLRSPLRVPPLSIRTWMPFAGGLPIMCAARRSPLAVRLIAVGTTGISAVLSVWVYATYDREGALTGTNFQFHEKIALVPPLGINYELGVDGISLLL